MERRRRRREPTSEAIPQPQGMRWDLVLLFMVIAVLMIAAAIAFGVTRSTGVASIGEYGGPDTYLNNVKLEEGSNITLTPSDAHNSLVIASTGGVTTFLGLADSPSSYSGQGLTFLRVNTGETALEFATPGGGGDIEAVGDVTTGNAFTGGGGTTLWFEGSTADAYEVILTSADPSGSDFTVTLPATTGTVTLDVDWDTWAEHPAVTSAYILVGNVSNQATAVNMTGDVGITNAGITSLSADVVASAEIAHSEDFGDISSDGNGILTLDTGVVSDNEIDYSMVTLTDFDYQTAWRIFYSDGSGDVTEFALGSTGTYLKSQGASSIPAWDTPAGGSGDITDVGDAPTGAAFTADGTGTQLWFEGATANTYEILLTSANPGADFTITLPATTGNVVTTGDTGTVTNTMLAGSIDISDKTNLVAGTNITLADDTLNVDDSFLLNDGDTGTGDYDFTGAILMGGSPLVFEGATNDAYQTTFAFTDPTSPSKTITFPNATGEVTLLGQTIGTGEVESGVTLDTEWDTWEELPAVTSTYILVGNVSNQAVAVAMSGDVNIDNTGATTLQTGVVADNEIDYSAVTLGDFDYQTAWRVFYSDSAGDVTELALGATDTYLKSAGVSSAPVWDTPGGTGDITAVGNIASGAAFTEADLGNTLYFEGPTDDTYEIALTGSDPGADYTVTLPSITGTVITTGDTGTVTNTMLASNIDAVKIADGTVSNTEFQYVGGLTSDAQTQIDTKAAGPGSSTDHAIARWDGAGGYTLQNSNVTIDDAGLITTSYGISSGGDLLQGGDIRFSADKMIDTRNNVLGYVGFRGWGSGSYVEHARLAPNNFELANGKLTGALDANSQNITGVGTIVLEGGTYDTTLQAGTPTESVTYTLPLADGTTNQVLTTSGTGTLSWSSAGTGDITDVGDASTGAAFTADGTGQNFWFEGSTADAYEVILTSADPSGSDFTITLPATTGIVVTTGNLTAIVTTGTVSTGTWGADFSTDIVKDTDIDWGTGGSQVSATDMTDFGTMTATSGYILVADGGDFESVAMSGDITIIADGTTSIGDDKVVEADLKAVDSASDEDILTYETTTGDFEWHSKDELGLYFYRTLVWYVDGEVSVGTQLGPTIYLDQAATVVDIELYAETSPTGATLIVDINEGGTTIFSTKPEIDISGNRDDGNHVVSDSSLAADAQITFDVDQVGSTVAGSYLTVMLEIKVLAGN